MSLLLLFDQPAGTGNPDQPYQTGVRSRRPSTGVVFIHGAPGAAAPPTAGAMPLRIISPVAQRLLARAAAAVIFLRAPIGTTPTTAKAMPPTVVTAVSGEAREARMRATRGDVDVTFLRTPLAGAATGNPDQPYQTGVRSRRPFTGVVFLHGSPLAAGPIAAKAPLPTIVQTVGSRLRFPRRPGRVIFQRESPANFDTDGGSPVTAVIQQSRQFFRRPTSQVSFLRSPQPPAAAPAAKAPPPAVVQNVAGEAREARARATDFVSAVLYLRNPARDGNTRPMAGRITLATLVPERAPRRPASRILSLRAPAAPVATRAIQPTVGTLTPERAPRRPVARVVFTRSAGGLAISAKGAQPTIATLVPERSSRRPRIRSFSTRPRLIPVTGVSYPCYIVTLTPRPTVYVLGARPPVVTLVPRQTTFALSARPATVTLLSRQTSFNINATR